MFSKQVVGIIAPVVCCATALLLGGLWFAWGNERAWEAIPLTALASMASGGITWQQVRARARSRWKAALDAYAERQIRKEQRNRALKRVRTRSTALAISNGVGNRLKTITQMALEPAGR